MTRKIISLLLVALLAGCTPAAIPEPSAQATAMSAPAQPTNTAAPPTEPSPEPTAAAIPEPVTLTVFAAASLTDAFNEIKGDFEAAHPGVTVVYNVGGSNALAAQLGQGAPADVFASANNTQMNVAVEAGRVISGTTRTFVRNRLVVIVPTGNPGGVATLQDLAKPGLKIVLAAKDVPVGQYSLDFLDKAVKDATFGELFKDGVLANVASYEENVRSVLTKVSLGEGDAGIVYASDISGDAADKVERLDIPDALNTIASYPIGTMSDSAHPDLAQAFMDYILAPEGQMVLAAYGFIPTTGDASGAAPSAVPVEVTGLVDTPTTFSADDLSKLDQTTIKATDKSGETTFTGVLLSTILHKVGVKPEAKRIVFTGGDGYSRELALADVNREAQAIIAIDTNGSLRNVLPSTQPKFWVKGLIKIEIK